MKKFKTVKFPKEYTLEEVLHHLKCCDAKKGVIKNVHDMEVGQKLEIPNRVMIERLC